MAHSYSDEHLHLLADHARTDNELGDSSDNDWNLSETTRTEEHGFVVHKDLHYYWIRLRYYVPVLTWLPSYQLEHLRSDAIAGLTVSCLLAPQGLSYAQALVKIPPIYGLYTCFVPLIIYGLLGTSRQLGFGPEALVSILVGASISEWTSRTSADNVGVLSAAEELAEKIEIANLVGLMVGLFTFLLGFFRLGFLDSVLSRALLRGFVTAVAVVVMIDLSPSLLGLDLKVDGVPAVEYDEGDSPIMKLIQTLTHLHLTHALTAVVSVLSIGFLLVTKFFKAQMSDRKWLSVVPEILVLVVASTALSQLFRWNDAGVAVLGTAAGGFVTPKIPTITLARFKFLMLSSILISIIGFVESIAVAKTYSTKHNYPISPNRELVAIGIANAVGSCFGSWPAFGSLGRSAVNDSAGARTQLAGLVTGGVILCMILWILPLFYYLPKAVCSAIIVVAALKLIEPHDFHVLINLQAWNDLSLLLLTFLTTILVSIEAGTLLSVSVSLLLVVKHTTKTRLAILGRTTVLDPKTGTLKSKFRSIHDTRRIERIEGGLIIRIEEGLFFGNTGQLMDRLKRIELHGDIGVHPGEEPIEGGQISGGQPLRSLIFDVEGVVDLDASATQTLYEICQSYKARGIIVCFVKVRKNCKPWFVRSGLYNLVGRDHFFKKINEAIEYIKREQERRTPEASQTHSDSVQASLATDSNVLIQVEQSTPRASEDETTLDVQPVGGGHRLGRSKSTNLPRNRNSLQPLRQPEFFTDSEYEADPEDEPRRRRKAQRNSDYRGRDVD
ncbi:sulfate transporter family-domain-containing protein [Polychytrium aggregatum]|uniref:sulfate transporter family-domain-containing protein n=1 Tax=Polychytrium aggregatum TaxID=110093 RepID=UPI0022FE3CA1|nr:sulfate transporter family-domain-containing protein [Polychytrium aggregatum]KAI9199812.1 sulfate transporter family-domain-containing protein [Polychytrium aggregatum]